jgi:hypothetical protein
MEILAEMSESGSVLAKLTMSRCIPSVVIPFVVEISAALTFTEFSLMF